MTPQEKKEDLQKRFESALTVKDCMLISIDEIIHELQEIELMYFMDLSNTEIAYYKQVKEAILKKGE